MENLNNVFIICDEEESKEISFLEDNKEKILNNYIENNSISDLDRTVNFWKSYFIIDPDIKFKIVDILLNLNTLDKNDIYYILKYNRSIDFYSALLDNLELLDNRDDLFYSKTTHDVVYLSNRQYPILVFQDKNFYYLIEIYSGEFSLYLLNKENNENIFYRLVMDMSL